LQFIAVHITAFEIHAEMRQSKFWQGTAKLLFCLMSKQLNAVSKNVRKLWVYLKKRGNQQVCASSKGGQWRVTGNNCRSLQRTAEETETCKVVGSYKR